MSAMMISHRLAEVVSCDELVHVDGHLTGESFKVLIVCRVNRPKLRDSYDASQLCTVYGPMLYGFRPIFPYKSTLFLLLIKIRESISFRCPLKK